jgi:hypothetical protein
MAVYANVGRPNRTTPAQDHRSPRRAFALSVATLVSTVMLASCGGSSSSPSSVESSPRPPSNATVTIVSPKDGSTLHGSTVDVRVRLVGGKIVPLSSTKLVPDEGHLHITLDDQLVSMTGDTSQMLKDVVPGQHLLTVEFVAVDHLPFNPRVIDEVSFRTVKG